MSDHDVRAAGIDRRTLVRTAIWATPVIAVVAPAPAFAASCTSRYAGTLDWAVPANYTRSTTNPTTAGSGTVTFANGVTDPYTLSSTFTNYTADTTNFSVTNPVGGTGAAGLTLFQTANQNGTTGGILNPKPAYFTANRANSQVVTMTFTTAVYDVSFLLTDLDSATGQFIDGVEVSMTDASGAAATYTATTPTGSTVTTGTGASGAPFRQAGDNTAANNNTGVEGNKLIVAAGPVKTIVFRYYNVIATDGVTNGTTPTQAMFIAKMSLASLNAGCP